MSNVSAHTSCLDMVKITAYALPLKAKRVPLKNKRIAEKKNVLLYFTFRILLHTSPEVTVKMEVTTEFKKKKKKSLNVVLTSISMV